ncbi:hypothetical protein ACFLU6_11155 [Acidobacteriota bacterium]
MKNPKHYVREYRLYFDVLPICVSSALIIAAILTFQAKPIYRAEAIIYLDDGHRRFEYFEHLSATASKEKTRLKGSIVRTGAAQRLNLTPGDVKSVLRKYKILHVRGTPLLKVIIESTDQFFSADYANSVVKTYSNEISNQSQLAMRVRVVEHAKASSNPIFIGRSKVLISALLVGSLAGLIISYAVTVLRTKRRSYLLNDDKGSGGTA